MNEFKTKTESYYKDIKNKIESLEKGIFWES